MNYKTLDAFFAFIRGGLWERDVQLQQYGEIEFYEILQISEEQSVVGLVTAGLEHVVDVKVPQEWILQFVGETLQIEQQNKEMNFFVAKLIEKLRIADIYAILIKGQGIAQCYERPLWRACGDVDLLLSDTNYEKAKTYMGSFSTPIEDEIKSEKHLALAVDCWTVELHGTFKSLLLWKMDKGIVNIQNDIFFNGNVRSWQNGMTTVFLPGIDDDIVLVFTHIVKHFFHGGVGLRQVCDECRLLWKYRQSIDRPLLGKRLKSMGVMSEWMAFASIAVDILGMPEEDMPFYSSSNKWKKKANKVLYHMLETGNFGQNRDKSYFDKYPYMVRKTISLWIHTKDSIKHFSIFPLDSIRVWCGMIKLGVEDIICK